MRQTRVFMDTAVSCEVVGDVPESDAGAAAERAFGWFAEVESRCTRFAPDSELRRLSVRPGEAVACSPLLCSAVAFALEVAQASGGAFDPTVGAPMEARGFTRNYRTGTQAPSGVVADARACWRDVTVDARAGTITLARPLLLDLGAVAKGLAIDLALAELAAFPGAAVNAGGDIAVRGVNRDGGAWRIGIRHPRQRDALWTRVQVQAGAVCTSGDYERRAPAGGGHILDPRAGAPAGGVASCTVIAPTAILADALGTAATVLGPERGISWLDAQGVDGLILTPALASFTTTGFARWEQCP